MPPLERYLKDVKAHLSSDQADDIVRELEENLRAQIEDREGALGRSLTDDEQEAILKAHGNPLLVAARYRPEQGSFTFGRQLIGPALFPAYTQVLAVSLSITLAVIVVATIVLAGGQPVGSVASTIALAAVIQFGVITGIFIAAEHAIDEEWAQSVGLAPITVRDPHRSIVARVADGLVGKKFVRDVPRRTSVSEFAIGAITLVWLVWVRPPVVIEGLRSGPGWETFWLPVVAVTFVSALGPVITFLRPRLVRFRSAVRAACDVGLLAIFAMSLNTGQWVALASPATATPRIEQLVGEINRWVGVSLGIAMAITAVMAALELWRLMAHRPIQPAIVQALG